MKKPSEMTDRELDAAIAVEVMEWEAKSVRDTVINHTFVNYVDKNGRGVISVENWNPTEFIDDAWQVVERMRELGWSVNILTQIHGYPASVTSSNHTDSINVKHLRTPRAICEAALAAVRNSKENP